MGTKISGEMVHTLTSLLFEFRRIINTSRESESDVAY